MKKKEKKVGECAYCGEITNLTDEHVIPRCLFEKPLPPDIVVVGVCERCNHEKSKDDDYLRDFLVTDMGGSEHPIAKRIFQTKTLSSARQNKSALLRTAKTQGRFEPVRTKGGIYLGEGYGIPLDGERVNRIFIRIVRGLYYKTKKKRIPDDYVFDVSRWDASEFNEIWPRLEKIGFNGPYRCGDVLTCLMLYAQEDEFITNWWLWFYDGICIHIATSPQGFKWEEEKNPNI
jgi:hypothetical protein